jgi:porphobilinogen deaminase
MLKWNFNVEVKDIRGNLETRLGKIGKGYDGIVLA